MAPQSQKTFINKYNFLYDNLNGDAENSYLKSFEFDSTSMSYKRHRKDQHFLRENVEVYTWYPYWMGDAWKTYDFDLISTLSFFSYKIDPKSGSYSNPSQISQWRSTDLLDTAKAHRTKILLNIALEGESNHQEFLKDEALWNTTIDSISVLLRDRDADGIELDFTDIPSDRETKFLDFVIMLKQMLEKRFLTKNMLLSLVIPADPDEFPIDLVRLNETVDLFVVKGLDYYEIDGTVAAVSPLRNESPDGPSLDNTIQTYLNRGLNPEKSILTLPLYGTQWSGTFDREEGYYSTDFERKVTLSEVDRVFQSKDSIYMITPNLDETTLTNYFFLEFPDDTSIEGWYDDGYTLSKKMDLALYNKFKGVGLWALGYDLGKNEVWEVVAEKFTGDTLYVKDPIKELDGYPLQVAAFLYTYKKLFVVTFSLATLAIIVSLSIAFSDWRFRETILARQMYRILVLSITCLLLLGIFSFFGLLGENNWSLVLLFILGAVSSYLVEKYGGLMKINKP
jgi:spore germination protein YaaH